VGTRLVVLLVATAAAATPGCTGDPASLGLGEQCDLNSECEAPLVCRLGRCRRECATLRDCPIEALCVTDNESLGACTLPEEETCSLDSDCPAPLVCATGRCVNECATDVDCTTGARCEDGSCVLPECNETFGVGCQSGFRCISLQNGTGACIQAGCTSDAQCTYNNHICVQDQTLQANICAPKPKPGPVAFAGVCNPAVANQRCQAGLFCLYLNGATTGHCSMICTGSGRGNCPSTSRGTTQCVVLNSQGQRACVITCTSSCPSGLSCQTVSGTFLCFP